MDDFWLLSAMSALAEFERRVENLFVTEEISKQGIYELRLCEMGSWINIIIDSSVPVDQAKHIAFTGPRVEQNIVEIWTVLLEKAWAKIYGSYQKLEGGYTKNALNDLTGAPVEDIETDNPMLWEHIKFSDVKNYIMCATPEEDENFGMNAFNELGL